MPGGSLYAPDRCAWNEATARNHVAASRVLIAGDAAIGSDGSAGSAVSVASAAAARRWKGLVAAVNMPSSAVTNVLAEMRQAESTTVRCCSRKASQQQADRETIPTEVAKADAATEGPK